MFQKHDYLNRHFEHKHSIVLQKKALVLQDVDTLGFHFGCKCSQPAINERDERITKKKELHYKDLD
ncbi:hypothetical protein Mapa_017853 [Marchantia paleacea]|nr:hypothetical protein Mapa_017853 [Marchantia paleacea]